MKKRGGEDRREGTLMGPRLFPTVGGALKGGVEDNVCEKFKAVWGKKD